MNLYYRKRVKVRIDMTHYLKNIPDGLPSKYQGKVITPESNHIFEKNETAGKLIKGYAQTLHMIMSKLLFLCKHVQPNILTVMAFITTQVIEPDKYDD